MKASVLIKELQETIALHGDSDVYIRKVYSATFYEPCAVNIDHEGDYIISMDE